MHPKLDAILNALPLSPEQRDALLLALRTAGEAALDGPEARTHQTFTTLKDRQTISVDSHLLSGGVASALDGGDGRSPDPHQRRLDSTPADRLPSSDIKTHRMRPDITIGLQRPVWQRASSERAPSAASAEDRIGGRYIDLGLIGEGGMGEVRRVLDVDLNRTLAMKLIHAPLIQRASVLARFIEEAQATAQLQHPNIVPVHDIGCLADGRLWFVMREIQGQTLSEMIHNAHMDASGGVTAASGALSLRRLATVFHTACQAVAYAHERGVVHRDLKPANIMVGRFGEVYVIDWGLAKILGRRERSLAPSDLEPIEKSRTTGYATQLGQVAGTPAYMPPEQAMGQIEQIDARSDVYALGAVLYEILSNRPPYAGTPHEVLEQLLSHPPIELSTADMLPEELVSASRRAMSRDPAERYPTAGELAAAVLEWLDGSRRREQALRLVSEAREKAEKALAYRQQAMLLTSEAAEMLSKIESWRPEEDKAPGWSREESAAELRRQTAILGLEQEYLLRAALTYVPELPDAHAALAAHYRAEHVSAEEERRDIHVAETGLRRHTEALPSSHPDRAAHLTYLRGDGALSLRTDPPGAEVDLYIFETCNRRRVPRRLGSLGMTPIEALPLPIGSYLCVIRHPERAPVNYPVQIRRGEHWDGVPPEGGSTEAIRLPRPGEIAATECYVPGGWTRVGGDPGAVSGLRAARVWIDSFVVQRFPVINRDYLFFLNSLAQEGRTAEALLYAPRANSDSEKYGELLIGYQDGRFSMDTYDGDVPVVSVRWTAAVAYARWKAARTGLDWKLIDELRWEKAARGVDGRIYPFGDSFDPSWANVRSSMPDRPHPVVVDSFPIDASVYGVRGCAGNVRDWCVDPFTVGGPAVPTGTRVAWPEQPIHHDLKRIMILRGGSWFSAPEIARMADRYQGDQVSCKNSIGFRLARPLPPDEEHRACDAPRRT